MIPFGRGFGALATGMRTIRRIETCASRESIRGTTILCSDQNSATATGSAVISGSAGGCLYSSHRSRHQAMTETNHGFESDTAVDILKILFRPSLSLS